MKRGLKWIGRVALTLAVTWVIVDRVGVTLDEALSLRGALPDPSLVWLGLSVSILLAGFLFGARLWGKMAAELGGRDPGLVASSRIFLSANLGRYLPGKVWQMAGLAVLSRRAGVSGTVGAAAGILGQAFSLIAAGLLSVPVVSGGAGVRPEAAWAMVALAAAVTLGTSSPKLMGSGLGLALRLARVPDEAIPTTGRLFGPRWIGWYLCNWAIYGMAFFAFLRGLGFQMNPGSVVPPFAGAYLLGYLAFFAPAGIGVREGFLIAFLRPALGGSTVGVAVLARLWMTAVELLPAGGMALWEAVREDAGPAAGGVADGVGGRRASRSEEDERSS